MGPIGVLLASVYVSYATFPASSGTKLAKVAYITHLNLGTSLYVIRKYWYSGFGSFLTPRGGTGGRRVLPRSWSFPERFLLLK